MNCKECGRFMIISREVDDSGCIYYCCDNCRINIIAEDQIEKEFDLIDKERIAEDNSWQSFLNCLLEIF